jgi:hypothetical protein
MRHNGIIGSIHYLLEHDLSTPKQLLTAGRIAYRRFGIMLWAVSKSPLPATGVKKTASGTSVSQFGGFGAMAPRKDPLKFDENCFALKR